MKRKLTFLLVPVLFLAIGVTFKLSPTRAQEQQTPDQKEEVCNEDAAADFVACKKAAADETQRQQCRDYFKCRRDACAAIRQGLEAKACMQPFKF